MSMKFSLSVLTPQEDFYEENIEQVVVCTEEGEMGIMAGHMPLIAVIPEGEIKIKKDDTWAFAIIGEGFFEISSTGIEFFVDFAKWEAGPDANEEQKKAAHLEYLRTHAKISRAAKVVMTLILIVLFSACTAPQNQQDHFVSLLTPNEAEIILNTNDLLMLNSNKPLPELIEFYTEVLHTIGTKRTALKKDTSIWVYSGIYNETNPITIEMRDDNDVIQIVIIY